MACNKQRDNLRPLSSLYLTPRIKRIWPSLFLRSLAMVHRLKWATFSRSTRRSSASSILHHWRTIFSRSCLKTCGLFQNLTTWTHLASYFSTHCKAFLWKTTLEMIIILVATWEINQQTATLRLKVL